MTVYVLFTVVFLSTKVSLALKVFNSLSNVLALDLILVISNSFAAFFASSKNKNSYEREKK